MSVEIKGVTKMYGEQHALNNISFTAEKGKVLGFLGPNGAGKSTTMKITTGYIAPTSGDVLVSGISVTENPLETKKLIGYLPEHNPQYLDLYIKEYLEFIGGLYSIKGNNLKKRVSEMIDLCGLGVEQHKKIAALSKGYRQRVGLAQALIHDPEVLILDEPTTGLDPNQIIEIRKVIKEAGQNKTVIFSTHIMQEVQALCDHVVIINKGQIVANDNVANIKTTQLKENHIRVAFENEIDINKLKGINGVNSVDVLENNTYLVKADVAFNVRSEISKLSAENNWNLVELSQKEVSLEDIFRTLTNHV